MLVFLFYVFIRSTLLCKQYNYLVINSEFDATRGRVSAGGPDARSARRIETIFTEENKLKTQSGRLLAGSRVYESL